MGIIVIELRRIRSVIWEISDASLLMLLFALPILIFLVLLGIGCWVSLAILLPRAVKRPRLLWLALPIAVPALLFGIGVVRFAVVELRPVKPLPLAGRYDLRFGREVGVLTLSDPASYTFCRGERPCETGRYSLEPFDAQIGFGRLWFSGAEMRRFTGSGVVNVDYQGWACPCMSFMDPDDGYQFVKMPE